MLLRTIVGMVLVLSMSATGCRKDTPEVQEKSDEHRHSQMAQVTTSQEFETLVLQADKPILVDFYATWCGPCKVLAPIIERLADEYAERVEFVKVDGDRSPELMTTYKVQAYPTVLIFSRAKPFKKLVGLRGAAEYRAALDEAISSQ